MLFESLGHFPEIFVRARLHTICSRMFSNDNSGRRIRSQSLSRVYICYCQERYLWIEIDSVYQECRHFPIRFQDNLWVIVHHRLYSNNKYISVLLFRLFWCAFLLFFSDTDTLGDFLLPSLSLCYVGHL